MLLSKIMLKWLEWIIEIGIWLTLVSAFIGGLTVGNGFFGSLIAAIGSTIAAGIFCALVFGFLIAVLDIRGMLKKAVDGQAGSSL